MTESLQILIVDDHAKVRGVLRPALEKAGFVVHEAASSAQAHIVMARHRINLVTVDVLLEASNEDGQVLAREIRKQYDCAIIMLSVLGNEPRHYDWLAHWADASIPKPFEPEEVVAQAQAILRRYANGNRPGGSAEKPEQDTAMFMGWLLNTKRHDLIAPDGTPVGLTMGEFALLVNFLKNSGEILTREWIFGQDSDGQDLDALDGDDIDRAVDMRISRLRRKLRLGHPSGRDLIGTVRGVGYKLKTDVKWESHPPARTFVPDRPE